MCTTAKVDLVRSIGADHVIDYTQGETPDGALRYDVILDIGGNRHLSATSVERSRIAERSSSSAARPTDAGSAASDRADPRATAVAVRAPEAGYVHLLREGR